MASPESLEGPSSSCSTVASTGMRTENKTSSSALLHRSLHNPPPKVVAAKGIWLTLDNGRRILDSTGGAAVSCLGHGDQRIIEAITTQCHQVAYFHSAFFTGSSSEDLALELVGSTNGNMKRAFIVSSGMYSTLPGI